MSVLIKGMEMPSECRNCRMMVYHENTGKTWCTPADAILAEEFKPVPFDYRPHFCPLVELPEKHGDLIDKDEAMKRWGLDKATKYGNETAEQQHFSYSTMMMYEIVDILDDAPVIIEAEGEE